LDDVRAIEPLSIALENDLFIQVCLECYASLELIRGSHIEQERQSLVKKFIKQIERLYSRTREEIHEREEVWYQRELYDADGTTYEVPYTRTVEEKEEVADPDYDGIHELIALIPISLHEQVKIYMSGKPQKLAEFVHTELLASSQRAPASKPIDT
jgi:hypothetical protein